MSYSLTEEFQIFLKQKIATGGESVEFEEVVACRLRDIKQSCFGKSVLPEVFNARLTNT